MSPEKVRRVYGERETEIENRLEEFRALGKASDERLFKELVFVILTSQSAAKSSWDATEELDARGLLLSGEQDEIAEVLALNDISYEDRKASFIVENRDKLSQPNLENPSRKLKLKDKINPDDLESTRGWLVENMKGMGYKAASHFLRNVGYGENFAIISTRIVRKLAELNVVESPELPGNREEYLELEDRLRKFSEEIGIPVQELDLVLWSMETGEVFK